ncbi:unnamed protein product, partial [Symbiodinium sp. CCMP2456]
VGASRERSTRTPTVSRQVLVPQLKDWRKPFKPRIKPERPDHKRFPDDEPMKSRPQFAKFALMAKELCWVTSKQLEDARREIVRATSRTAKEWPGLVGFRFSGFKVLGGLGYEFWGWDGLGDVRGLGFGRWLRILSFTFIDRSTDAIR